MIKVYGVPLSPFVRKVLFTLEYKNLAYDLDPVFPGSDDEAFRAISPLGKIPVLEHDGFTTPDSSIICRYLDQSFPENSIYPREPRDDARATWIEEWADTTLIGGLGGLFAQRFLNPRILGQATDEEQVANLLDKQIPPALAYLETIVPEEGVLIEGGVSIADIAVVTCFVQGQYADFEPDARTYPRIRRYLDYTLNVDLVKNRLKQEQDVLANIVQ